MKKKGVVVSLVCIFLFLFVSFSFVSASAVYESKNLGNLQYGTRMNISINYIGDGGEYAFVFDNNQNLANNLGVCTNVLVYDPQNMRDEQTSSGLPYCPNNICCPFTCSPSNWCNAPITRVLSYIPSVGSHLLRIQNFNAGSGCGLGFSFFINNVLDDSYSLWLNSCQISPKPYKNYTFCIYSCPSPSTVACGISLGNGGCTGNVCSVGGSTVGNNCSVGSTCTATGCVLDSQLSSIKITNRTGSEIHYANTYAEETVNISVYGVGLNASGVGKLNYTIYNSTGSRVYNYNKTAYNSTFDSFSWTTITPGNYSVNVSFTSILGSIKSSEIRFFPFSRIVNCNLTIPGNSSWNNIGTFMQIWNFTSSRYEPIEKNATFNLTAGECNFKCNINYAWNATSKTCYYNVTLPTPPPVANICGSLTTESSCDSASMATIRNSIPDYSSTCVGIVVQGGCNKTTSCYCYWDIDTCKPSFDVNITCITPSQDVFGRCLFTTSVTGDCNEGKTSFSYNIFANWQPSTVTPDVNCVNQTKRYECPVTEELSFFGVWQFIFSFIAIALVYMIYLRKK